MYAMRALTLVSLWTFQALSLHAGRMNAYWLYDLPHWLFAAIVVVLFVTLSLGGVFATKTWVRKLHLTDHSHNDIVGYFLAFVTVVYGITLGLVAVGTWDNYATVQAQTDGEAQIVASMYRDAGAYDDPQRTQLRQDLKTYLKEVVTQDWPQQRRGIVPSASGPILDQFETDLMSVKAGSRTSDIIQAEIFKQYNRLVEARRSRLRSVVSHLPGAVWALVILGGLITVAVTWFFDVKSLGMHLWMTGLSAALLGLVIFLIGTLDSPYRGTASIGPQPYQMLYDPRVTTQQ